jgi:hypothetical protein
MELLSLDQNVLAQNVKSTLTSWWNSFSGDFIGQAIQLKNSSFPLLQKEYAVSQGKLPHNTTVNIPYLEISPLYKNAKHGALFVNCNPSGTDYSYYRTYNKNNNVCFYYGEFKKKNPYFQECEKFAQEVGVQQFAMIDVFPLVMQNQAVLKKAFKDAYATHNNQETAFDELLKSFLNTIECIEPEFIVVTNAFVKDLFTKENYQLHKLLTSFHEDKDRVCYDIGIGQLKTTLFCGGMIAGGHRMDTESRRRLTRDVRHFLSHTPLQF